MTATATGSSWARAPASSSWKSWNTPRPAAPRIYAEVVGYGLSGDAYHITAPVGGRRRRLSLHEGGAERAGPPALRHRLHQCPRHLDHGRHDRTRCGRTPRRRMRRRTSPCPRRNRRSATCSAPPARSRRSFSILAIRDNVAPPTLNLDNPERPSQIDLVPKVARQREINVALSNSFGFGGTNASLILSRYDG